MQLTVAFLTALTLSLSLLLGQQGNDSLVSSLIKTAIEQMRLGNLPAARIELGKALRLDPGNAQANFELGLLFGQLGNVPAATEAFRKAVSAKPTWAEPHYNLALTLVAESNAKRDWPAAMLELREALQLRPDYVEARHLLGVGLLETGERSAAITQFTEALNINPNSPEIQLDLGKALQDEGHLSDAEQAMREALRLRPAYADANVALGKLLAADRSRGAVAIESLERALRINPDNAGAQYTLARVLRDQGRTAEANVALRQAAALTKRQQDVVQATRLSNEGLDAAHKGDLPGAAEKLRQAVALCPNAAIPHYNLGLLSASRGDLDTAKAQVVQAISLAPLDLRFYKTLGQLWAQSGDGARSRAALARAAELDGSSANSPAPVAADSFEYGSPKDTPDSHFAFASLLAKRGDWLGACGEWLRVLALRPADLDARNNLGVTYAHLGNDDQAELEFGKALQINRDSAAAHFGLAMLDLQHGNQRHAIVELKEVVRIDPNYPQAKNLLAKALIN